MRFFDSNEIFHRRLFSMTLIQKSRLLEFLPRHPEFEKMIPVAEGCLSFQPENRLGFGEISEKVGTLFVCIFFIHLLNPLQKKEGKYPLFKQRAAAQENQG
jgi:hypothetical protein